MARTTAAEWARRVERWQRSGESATAFGARERIAASQLRWWKWHLAKVSTPTSAFLPVRVVPRAASLAEPTATPIEIALPSGARLRVVSGVDEETLKRVVRALEAACS